MGQLQKATELLKEVIQVRQKLLTEEQTRQLQTQYLLALVYQEDGKANEAVELLEPIVRLQATTAQQNPFRLQSLEELARAYRADGRAGEAVKMLEGVIYVRRRSLPSDILSLAIYLRLYSVVLCQNRCSIWSCERLLK